MWRTINIKHTHLGGDCLRSIRPLIKPDHPSWLIRMRKRLRWAFFSHDPRDLPGFIVGLHRTYRKVETKSIVLHCLISWEPWVSQAPWWCPWRDNVMSFAGSERLQTGNVLCLYVVLEVPVQCSMRLQCWCWNCVIIKPERKLFTSSPDCYASAPNFIRWGIMFLPVFIYAFYFIFYKTKKIVTFVLTTSSKTFCTITEKLLVPSFSI